MPQMVASTQPDTLDREASMVPPGAGGLVFHPFLAGASGPIWRSDLTAAFVGLRADHHRGHMYRAVLEGAAFLLEDGMRYVNGAGVPLAPSTTVVDAGLGTALWRRIVADVVGRPLAHIAAFPGTAYGAAMLAAVGARLAREEDVLGWVPTMRTVNPTEDEAVRAAYVEARERFWRTMRALHGDVGGAPAKGGA
jgi:xylulokinase